MAQPSAAREPSMEEILASIRQIIESNEPGAGRSISSSLPPVYGDDEDAESAIHLTVDDAYAGVEFPEPTTRPDPRFVAANSSGTVPEPEVPARALSLADVAARVRAASERNTTAPRDAAPAAAAEPPRATEPRAFEQRPLEQYMVADEPLRGTSHPARPSEPARPQPQVSEAPAGQALPARSDVETSATFVQPAREPEAIIERSAQPMPVFQPPEAARQPAPSQDIQPRPAEEAQPALLSQGPGLQIARSFEQLAAAVDGAEQRSLDQIAEELLRPMLRDWLDDNLPPLVERLVREEIERVARGPRR